MVVWYCLYILKSIKLHTLDGQTSWHVNYISVKLLKKKNSSIPFQTEQFWLGWVAGYLETSQKAKRTGISSSSSMADEMTRQ